MLARQRYLQSKLLSNALSEESEPQTTETQDDRMRRARAEEEAILAPVILQTTLVSGEANTKRRRVEKNETVDAEPPPLPSRAELEDVGESVGSLFSATYGNAALLGKTLGRLKKFVDTVPLLFNKNGLEICFLDRSRVTQPSILLPTSAFARYEGLVARKIAINVPAQTLLKFATMCTPQHSLTFMYDQRGDKSAKLHMMLYPRDLNLRNEQMVRTTVPAVEGNQNPIAPNENYQYAVTVSPSNFALNVKRMEAESTTVRLVLGTNAFDLAAVNDQGKDTLMLNTTCVATADEMTSKTCMIACIGPTPQITTAELSNYRVSAVYLSSIATFGDLPECRSLVLRFGGVRRPDGSVAEQPLHLRFDIGEGQMAYHIDCWLATRVND